nr:FAD-dependent oxidoreductase [Micromonospora sp. DSM 115978]
MADNDSYERQDCDVLVVGSGAAGLAAAVAAAHRGLRVLLLERDRLLGGTSALSGGWVYAPGHRRPDRPPEPREEITSYLRALAGPAYRADRVNAFLDAAPEMVEFFEQETRVRFAYPERAPDYHPELPGARVGGRAIHSIPFDARRLGPARLLLRPPLTEMTVFGVVPQIGSDLQNFLQANSSLRSFGYVARRIVTSGVQRALFRRTTALSNGNALVAMLLASALDAGVDIRTSARVRRLRRTAAGRIDGAEVTIAGRPMLIEARRGVVLANGGFSHDRRLTKELFPHRWRGQEHHSMTVETNDGDGIRLAEEVGAVFESDVAQPAAWAPVTVFDGPGGGRGGRRFPHLRGIGLPGLIAVDRRGRRFGNEADSYHDFGQAMIQAGDGAHLIGDSRTMHRYGIGYAKPWPLPRLRYYRNRYLVVAKTLDGLADRIGVDATGLRETVEEYNRHAHAGRDPQFRRGESTYNTFRGDPRHRPNPSVGPVERAPFYAVPITIGDLGTFAGLATDARSRVVNGSGEPIPGLYAAGSVAVSVFGGAYPGYGAMLGHGLVSGYLAAQDLAGSA